MKAAEQIIKQRKKQKQRENIDYVHPRNNIQDGFVIINYQKRNIVSKSVLDEKIEMPMPEEWMKLPCEKEKTELYGFPKEKEMLLFTRMEPEENDREKALEEILKAYQGKVERKHSGSVITGEKVPVKYIMFTDSERMFFVIFQFCMEESGILGVFISHYYRKKAWEKIIPQLLENIRGECTKKECTKGKEEKQIEQTMCGGIL